MNVICGWQQVCTAQKETSSLELLRERKRSHGVPPSEPRLTTLAPHTPERLDASRFACRAAALDRGRAPLQNDDASRRSEDTLALTEKTEAIEPLCQCHPMTIV